MRISKPVIPYDTIFDDDDEEETTKELQNKNKYEMFYNAQNDLEGIDFSNKELHKNEGNPLLLKLQNTYFCHAPRDYVLHQPKTDTLLSTQL